MFCVETKTTGNRQNYNFNKDFYSTPSTVNLLGSSA